MNTTWILRKQTAKDIYAIRRAQNTIDRIELDDGYGYKPPDSPNVAYLLNGSMLPPFRCDIVAKWAGIADRQQNYGLNKPDENIYFTAAENGEVTLRCGQSSVKLYAINQGTEPPIHPLPITFDGDEIKLGLDAKEITAKAKLLTSKAAQVKKERAEAAKVKADQAAQAEYERCKAIVTPEAVARCAKRVKRLHKLTNWLRNVDKALDKVPSLPQLINNPLFNAFDPEYSEAYGNARLAYLEAKRKRDNFKPRSWRSNGREKHHENVKQAFHRTKSIAFAALTDHVNACGFECYSASAHDPRKYNANDVRRCREYIRTHERRLSETARQAL